MNILKNCVCLQDFIEAAKEKMSVEAFQYINSGSQNEKTLKQNESSFHKLMIIPRILISSSVVDMTSELFGKKLSLPFGFAPWAMNVLANPDGQIIPAKVAYQSKIIYTLSSLSTKSFSEVSSANHDGLRLMQMYISSDWKLTETVIKLAEKYGFTGLAITVDAQVLGTRKRQSNTALDTSKIQFPVLQEIHSSCQSKSQFKNRHSFLANRDLALTWETIKKIRSLTKLKIVLKGIMHPKDAEIAIDYCDAIWVSNHGGRQLDSISSTINILPFIKRAVGNRIPILVDGGIRTGNDIYKCLAYGANYVFIGRPVAYSLVFGYEGVKKLVNILEDQLRRTMILVGCRELKDINEKSVIPEPKL